MLVLMLMMVLILPLLLCENSNSVLPMALVAV
jgi:hypothetical protein